MQSLVELPTELILRILQHLPYMGLSNLSLTCSFMYGLASPQLLPMKNKLVSKYRWYETERPRENPERHFLHHLLADILYGRTSANFVMNIACDEVLNGGHHETTEPYIEPYGRPVLDETGLQLLLKMVSQVPTIHESERQEYVSEICKGSEDAIIAVLLPLLHNLRYILLPVAVMGDADTCIRRVSQMQSRLSRSTIGSRIHSPTCSKPMIPLGRLSYVHFHQENGEWGPYLEDILPVVCLPSLKTLSVPRVHETRIQERQSSTDLPLGKVRAIFFPESSISTQEILAFATHLGGPCIIRLTHHFGGNDWNVCEIGGEVDQTTGLIMEETRSTVMHRFPADRETEESIAHDAIVEPWTWGQWEEL